MLVDASKYPEWHIGVHKVKHITMPPEMDSTAKGKTKNAIASHVLHDVISLETDVASNHVVKLINKVSRKLQGDSLIRKIHVANRFAHFLFSVWRRVVQVALYARLLEQRFQQWTAFNKSKIVHQGVSVSATQSVVHDLLNSTISVLPIQQVLAPGR